MLKLVLDTNFLMIPLEFKVDIYSEFDRLFDELEEISDTFEDQKAIFQKKMEQLEFTGMNDEH